MKSCLYVGHIQHRRHLPKRNEFNYRTYMLFLDLDELPKVFDPFWLWSTKRPALAWFRRQDFHGNPTRSLSECVRDTVFKHTAQRPTGPIRLLTQLRVFGYSFNPVSFYYIYDASDTKLEFIMAEITNTPWNQRYCYVLNIQDIDQHPTAALTHSIRQWHFTKQFHVSPFMPMNMDYDWRFSSPNEMLRVHMENWMDGHKHFDATLTLQRQPLSSKTLALSLLSIPFISLKVITLIYWQALKLLLKGVPFYTHPNKPPSKSPDLSDDAP